MPLNALLIAQMQGGICTLAGRQSSCAEAVGVGARGKHSSAESQPG